MACGWAEAEDECEGECEGECKGGGEGASGGDHLSSAPTDGVPAFSMFDEYVRGRDAVLHWQTM